MNRLEKKALILGFLQYAISGLPEERLITGIKSSLDDEEFQYALDEYLGMQDDILTGAAKEMAEFEKKQSDRLKNFDTDPPSTPPTEFGQATSGRHTMTERRHDASCIHGDCWCKPGSDGT